MLSYSVICVLFLSSFQLLNAFNQTDNYFDESEYVEEVRRHMQEVRDQFGDDLKDTYERDITDYIRRRKRSWIGTDQRVSVSRHNNLAKDEFLLAVGKACDLPKQIGINDACMCQSGPHKTMVELEMINGDISGNTLQMPRCISIDRCSSSCSSPTHKCVAVDKEMVKVPVSILSPTQNMQDECRVIEIEKHKKCDCVCALSEANCKEFEIFNKNTCKCACKINPSMCGPKMRPNYRECRCDCKNNKECSSGSLFNTDTCECEEETYEDYNSV